MYCLYITDFQVTELPPLHPFRYVYTKWRSSGESLTNFVVVWVKVGYPGRRRH
jgi:hypothetical protein